MLPTYPAVLRDGRLEWGNEGAPEFAPNQPIPVHVTVLAPECLPSANGSAMAAALTAFVAAGGRSNFGQPGAGRGRPDRGWRPSMIFLRFGCHWLGPRRTRFLSSWGK